MMFPIPPPYSPPDSLRITLLPLMLADPQPVLTPITVILKGPLRTFSAWPNRPEEHQ
jgi:hypothetical protein